MIAVLLMLAVLPSAATVSSPMSAAILEASLREARLVHIQRERPNPTPRGGVAQRDTWRSVQAVAAALGSGGVLSATSPPISLVCRRGHVVEAVSGASAPGMMVRSGMLGLPPPRA
ncbi:MAG: hypothetical protein LDL56_09600 [Armatimonadetes bacterium]|nr:hypothetical protein [Armatimonadota bacterium]